MLFLVKVKSQVSQHIFYHHLSAQSSVLRIPSSKGIPIKFNMVVYMSVLPNKPTAQYGSTSLTAQYRSTAPDWPHRPPQIWIGRTGADRPIRINLSDRPIQINRADRPYGSAVGADCPIWSSRCDRPIRIGRTNTDRLCRPPTQIWIGRGRRPPTTDQPL